MRVRRARSRGWNGNFEFTAGIAYRAYATTTVAPVVTWPGITTSQ